MTIGSGRGSSPRQILVDVSVVASSDARTGIQRVVRAIWLELKQQNLIDIIVRPVMALAEVGYCYAPDNFLDAPVGPSPKGYAPVDIRAGDIFLGLDLTAHLLPRHERQLHEWKRTGASIHFIVYDLLPLQNRRWFRWRARRHFRRWIVVVERLADQVICISPSVARDFSAWMRRLRITKPRAIRISTIKLGCNISSSGPDKGLPCNSAEILEWVSKHRTILMVGTIEPRKAYDKALAAAQHLWQNECDSDIAMLIVGKPGWKTRRLEEKLRRLSSTKPKLRWLDNVSDEFLEHLYEQCTGILFTSYAEGLGLPLIEAAAHGKTLLVRDIPVFRELELQNCRFFADDSAEVLSEEIRNWLSLTSKNIIYQNKYSLPTWKESANEIFVKITSQIAI